MARETKECPYCGETILAAAKKCRYCGEWLTEKPATIVDSETFIKNALASRFEINEEIGRGGMSVVYKAVQKSLNRVVALKILPQQFTHDPEFLERFHREAQSAAKLDHPNIVTIFDEGAENGVHYIAMKYIAGENLHTRIQRQGALSVAEMKQIVLPIADGLSYAHEAGMVHRDIKSANILIDKKGRAVLTDFGIARATESKHLTQPGTVLGTPEYMSPEQAQGEKTDARSDIYSLGVVMYECLTGRLPFQSDNMLGTIHKITHEAPTAPGLIRSDIPEQVENVVLRCLAKEAADRYANCSEFAEALEKGESRRIVEKEPVATPEPEKPKPVSAKKKTTPGAAMPGWWKAAMGFVSYLLVIVVILLIRQLSQKPYISSGRKVNVVTNVPADKTVEEAMPDTTAADKTALPAPPVVQAPEDTTVAVARYEIENMLRRARAYLASNQLTTPAGRNALEMVQKILSLDSGNSEALGLKQDIAGKYESLGDAQLGKKAYNKAVVYYRNSLKIKSSPGVEQKLAEAVRFKAEEQKLRSNLVLKGIEMVFVKGGKFYMGSNDSEADNDEHPVHRVYVDDFYISKYEITNARFCRFLNEMGNQSEGGDTWLDITDDDCKIVKQSGSYIPVSGYANHPVIEVTWYGARAYCKWAGGRLPTEAEWEYAARGGSKSRGYKYSGSNNIGEVAWYGKNSSGKTHPIGQKKHNELGLYDMSGNVCEWCADLYGRDYYKKSPYENPKGPASASFRVLRGGSWIINADYVRSAIRYSDYPNNSDYTVGFRCVR